MFSYCEDLLQQVGGPGIDVQIDETVMGKTKYGRGKQGEQSWYFGGIEQRQVMDNNGKIEYKAGLAFACYVPRRNTATLLPLIQKHIRQDATIWSDEWAAYRCLRRENFNHFTGLFLLNCMSLSCCVLVCHKRMYAINAVEPDGTIHRVNTNCIEGFWSGVKNKFKQIHGTSSDLQESYFFEYVFRNNCRVNNVDFHSEFWRIVSLKYGIE